MHRAVKVSILLLVLVVPALIFIFLKGFGKNHYALPYFHIEEITVAGDTLYHNIKDPVLENKITVVSFFAFPCDVGCQERLSQLNRVQDMFGEYQDIQLLSIFDNGSDADKLDALVETYQVNRSVWQFDVLDNEEYQKSTQRYRLSYWPKEQKNEPAHLHKLILVDKEGFFRGYYDGQDLENVDRLILEMRVLLQAS